MRIEEAISKTAPDAVSIERLERTTWHAASWTEVLKGDIVRFRDPDGKLQHDEGVTIGEKKYREIRDWIVVEAVPYYPTKEVIVPIVQVEPHDFDLDA